MLNRAIVVVALSVTGVSPMFLGTPPSELRAQANPVTARSLAGAWGVQVTTRDCTTQAPLGSPFSSLVSFHEGGTITETPGGRAFAPGQRTNGHGTWTRQPDGSYLQEFIALILFDTPANLPGTPTFNPAAPITPGFLAGWQRVSHTITLADGDHGSSSGTNALYKANGDLYRSGCSSAVIQRIQ